MGLSMLLRGLGTLQRLLARSRLLAHGVDVAELRKNLEEQKEKLEKQKDQLQAWLTL